MVLEDKCISHDDVFKKLGRNILLFQQLEYLLKQFLFNRKLYVKFSGAEVKITRSDHKKSTLGGLKNYYLETLRIMGNDESDDESDKTPNNDELSFSFEFVHEVDLSYYEKKKSSMDKLVTDRNQLVHHLIPSFNINDPSAREVLARELDNQMNEIKVEMEDVLSKLNNFDAIRQYLVGYLSSDDFMNFILDAK